MTTYPYRPPGRELSDTMLAYRDWKLASTWSVRVDSDPLGPVNKVVRLMRGVQQVRAALARVPEGADVRLVRDEGAGYMEWFLAAREAFWEFREIEMTPPPGWRVEVDGETVLSVTDAEIAPEPPVRRSAPFWVRARRWVSTRTRSFADGAARRYGYHRDGECGWDE